MDLSLSSNVAIVQGASRGIGFAIARSLLAEGCKVLITGRHEDTLAEAKSKLAETSAEENVLTFGADSADLEAIPRIVSTAQDRWGRVDILCANSGGPPAGNLAEISESEWSDCTRLLLQSPLVLFQNAWPWLQKSSNPRLFVITSSSTRQPIPGLALSNIFRPAVYGMIKTIAQEFGPHGVCCHSIAPGRIDTQRLNHVLEKQAYASKLSLEEHRKSVESSIPLRHIGSPNDVGSLVTYLSSPLAGYLTGGNWLVDGGLIQSL